MLSFKSMAMAQETDYLGPIELQTQRVDIDYIDLYYQHRVDTHVLIEVTPAAPKLGTLMVVFIPCIQSILGIIYYIRFSRIVGMAGIGGTLLLVSLCGTCTFLTSISLSAIATNGAMKGVGPYYLIGRALGPEVGVSIGLCFFLGNAVAGALYVLGAVETFLKAVPSAGIFREGITGLSSETFKEYWSSDYQKTNSAGIPETDGSVTWDFK